MFTLFSSFAIQTRNIETKKYASMNSSAMTHKFGKTYVDGRLSKNTHKLEIPNVAMITAS